MNRLYGCHAALQLNAAYADIGGIGLWPMTDAATNTFLGQNLTIWLHSTANFTTDTSKVACAVAVKTNARIETYIQCAYVPGVRYVTIQRFATAATQLALQEVRVYRKSEHACMDIAYRAQPHGSAQRRFTDALRCRNYQQAPGACPALHAQLNAFCCC